MKSPDMNPFSKHKNTCKCFKHLGHVWHGPLDRYASISIIFHEAFYGNIIVTYPWFVHPPGEVHLRFFSVVENYLVNASLPEQW